MSFNFLSVPFLVTVIAAAQFNHDNSAENGQYAGRAASYNPYGNIHQDRSNMYSRMQMLQPLTGLTSNATTDSPDLPTAVEVRIKLKSYLDQGLRLPNGMTCVCPSGFQCSYLGTVEPRCFMAFSVMVSPPRGSIQYMTTEFLPLTDSGALDLSRVTNEQANQWSQPHVFHLNGKPAAISVFVHHMGVEINAQTGALAQMQSVVHVDTFVQDLQQVLPTTASKNDDHSVTLTGQVIQTQLSLSYSVKCAGDALGMNCDLQCNQSSVQSDIALCRSIDTGFLYTCSYTDNNLQVKDCNPCPWGIAEDSYCRDEQGNVLNPATAQVVAPGYKTATITLAVIAGILFILLMIVTIYSCVLVKRQMSQEQAAPGYNYHSSLRAEGNANRPLLEATYHQSQSPVPSDRSFQNAPSAAPRSIPNLDAMPGKPALRKTNYIPPAHMGGTASVNDTIDSLASVPMPPSREADV